MTITLTGSPCTSKEGDPPSVLAHHLKSFTPTGEPVPYGGKPAFRTGLTCTHNGFALDVPSQVGVMLALTKLLVGTFQATLA
ncbi:MAG: hypothetical protein KME57_30630 [Scytonema hyalinum WJT4-NPBG1]|nr:hypothetical protein [Scytonema hyalinum WJT4-NPBG1]